MTTTISLTDWYREQQFSRGLARALARSTGSATEIQRLPAFYPSCESSPK